MPKKLSFKKNNIVTWLLCVLGLVVILMCAVGGSNYENFDVVGASDYSDLGSAPVVALFHSKGCPHCVNLMPTWDKFKDHHKDGKVKVVEMEKDKDKDMMSKHKIEGFPTIRMYKEGFDGEHTEYSGDRSLESLNDFVSGKENFALPDQDQDDESEIQTHEARGDIDVDSFIPGYSDTEYFTIEQLEPQGVQGAELNDTEEEVPLNAGDQ